MCVRVNPHGAMAEPRISHILSGILSGIFSAILSDIFSGIMSDICSDSAHHSIAGGIAFGSKECSEEQHLCQNLETLTWHREITQSTRPEAPKKPSTSTTRSVDLKDILMFNQLMST